MVPAQPNANRLKCPSYYCILHALPERTHHSWNPFFYALFSYEKWPGVAKIRSFYFCHLVPNTWPQTWNGARYRVNPSHKGLWLTFPIGQSCNTANDIFEKWSDLAKIWHCLIFATLLSALDRKYRYYKLPDLLQAQFSFTSLHLGRITTVAYYISALANHDTAATIS